MDIGMEPMPQLPPSQSAFGPLERELIRKCRDRLDAAGFVHGTAEHMRSICGNIDLSTIMAAADKAPVDPYDVTGLRRRYFRTACYQPKSRTLTFDKPSYGKDGKPFVIYHQTTAANLDQGGRERRFAPLPDQFEQDRGLLTVVCATFEMIPGDLIKRRRRQEVGIHITRLWSDGRRRAIPSPPHLHTDGEPWTAIILLDRVNVAVGSAVNYVAARDCRGQQPQDCHDDDILATITLREQLELIIVDDRRVSHHVSGVHGADGQPGWRTSLLIDFSPLYPERTT